MELCNDVIENREFYDDYLRCPVGIIFEAFKPHNNEWNINLSSSRSKICDSNYYLLALSI